LIEQRWNRIRMGALLASSERKAKQSPKPPRNRKSTPINWKKYLTFAAALTGIGLAGNLALAWMRMPTQADVKAGSDLFAHKWEANDPLSKAGDGLGPVFNAKSCAECHFQGGIGGGGGMQNNVASFEVLPTLGHPKPTGGVIHAATTTPGLEESVETVSKVFPIVPRGVTLTAVCQAPLVKDYNPVIHHSINTPTLFGAGKIDRIPAYAIRAQQAKRVVQGIEQELALKFDRPGVGRIRVLADGRIGKFGWKAQFATLEEFVANACAVEVGLTTPSRKQHKPQQHVEDPSAKPDLDRQQFAQLVSYVTRLPAPEVVLPSSSADQAKVKRGQELFGTVGCAECHTPDLGGAQGVYSDFCLHDLTDPEVSAYEVNPQVPVPEDHPKASEWKTPPLWGVAQTAPYLHDGSAGTLAVAIEAHAGQAKSVREAYRNLPQADREAVLMFLGSLATKSE
jgi:CxxC motif-containing protein (DUF1111 family)